MPICGTYCVWCSGSPVLQLIALLLSLQLVKTARTGNAQKGSANALGLGTRAFRRLLDAEVLAASPDVPADITVVTTAAQLQAAVISGAQDIQLRAHVDLSGLALAFNSDTSQSPTVLGTVKPSTRSIRGNCSTAPPTASQLGLVGPDFLWTAPQCVIINDHDIISTTYPLWLDALYLRSLPTNWHPFRFFNAWVSAELYGTRLTLQGHGSFNITAVTFGEAKVLLEGCRFDSIGGFDYTFNAYDGSLTIKGSTVSNVLQRNTIAYYDAEMELYQFAGIIIASGEAASVTVLDTAFENVDAVDLFWSWSAAIFADNLTYSNVTTVRNQWDAAGSVTGSGNGLDIVQQYLDAPETPLPTSDFSDVRLVPRLSLDDTWIVSVQQAMAAATPSQIQAAPEPPPIPNPPDPPELGVAGDAAASIAAVYTAPEFQDAFHEGVRDIEIYNHLDLRGLPERGSPIVPSPSGSLSQIGFVGNATRSIRGKCTTRPEAAFTSGALGTDIKDEEPWRSPRCVIITSVDLLFIDRSRLWVDSLAIQIIGASDSVPIAFSVLSWGHAYITDTVVQGDRNSDAVGADVFRSGGGLYAEGCVFNALEGEADRDHAISIINGNAYFNSCVFRGLSRPQSPDTPGEYIIAFGALYASGLNSTLALEGCSFDNIYNAWPITVNRGALLYSDNSSQTSFGSHTYRTVQPLPLTDLPEANLKARRSSPLLASDPWFVAAKQALVSPPTSAYLSRYPIRYSLVANVTAALAPVQPGSEDPGDDPSVGLIIGVALAVVAPLCVCAVVAFLVARTRRKGHQAGSGDSTAPQAYMISGSNSMSIGVHKPMLGPNPMPEERRPGGTARSATLSNQTKTTWEDFQKAGDEARTAWEELHVALDAMNSMQAPFCYRFHLQSAAYRRKGGQGVVQFAGIANTYDRAAIKFYFDRTSFDKESELYSAPQLNAMMPATLAMDDNASGHVCTPYGYKFPPFVIIECGQSLDEWARDTINKDFVTIFQALSHAARALQQLHAFGYAHRDIKPGNILRRPKHHDWTLIDFGCAARIGSKDSLIFSLKYAAPEVVHALEAGSKTIQVDTAVDTWSIGVIAFELLTGDRAFADTSVKAVQDALAGRTMLPWEGPSSENVEQFEKLRRLRPTVLRCLERDPTKRPTAAELVRAWDHAFDFT